MGKAAGRTTQFIVVLVGVALTLLLSWQFRAQQERNALSDFESLTTEGTDALIGRLRQYEVALEGLGGFLDVNPNPTRAEARGFVKSFDLDRLLPGVNGIGFAEAVKAEDLPQFVAETAAMGPEPFAVHPVLDRPEHLILKFMEPYAGNEEALGLDLNYNETRYAVAMKARDSGMAQLTQRIVLVQDETRQPGFALDVPHYRKGAPIETVEQRRAAFDGIIAAPFVGARALSNLTSQQNVSYHFAVYDGTAEDPDALIYDSLSGSAHVGLYRSVDQIELYGRTWTIVWESMPAFEAAKSSLLPFVLMLLGLFVTGLVALRFHDLVRRHELVAKLVAEKTRALDVQRTQNESILNNPLIAILITDASGVIVRMNKAARKLLGLSADTGADLTEILPETADMKAGTQLNLSFQRGGECISLAVKKNDWEAPGQARRSTFFLRDVTEEQRASAAVAEAEQRLELALRASQIGVYEIDLETGKSIVSGMWLKIMGVEEADADFDAQAYFMALIDPDDFHMLQANDAACISGKTEHTTTEFRVHLKGGSRWMRSDGFVSKRDENGKALRLLGTQIDVTESREIDRVKNEFIATVSHELRTPITSVKGAIGLLNNNEALELPASAKRLLEIAQTNVDRLTVLINDILDLERVQTGSMRLEIKPHMLNQILRDAREQVLPIARANGLSITLHEDPENPEISTDRGRILQVLSNLLSNACKFAPEGSAVEIGAETGERGPRIFVRDTGPGVPEAFIPSLFDPFTQADTSDTREKSGTGLGLSIARQLLEQMNGEIGYRRTEAGQSEFFVTLTDVEALGGATRNLMVIK